MCCVSTFFCYFYVDRHIIIGDIFFKSYGIKHITIYAIFFIPLSWFNARITQAAKPSSTFKWNAR